jgi:hypothetical protein
VKIKVKYFTQLKDAKLIMLLLFARLVGEEKYVQNLVGKSQNKRQLGRPRHRWEDNIRMDLREIGWEVVD